MTRTELNDETESPHADESRSITRLARGFQRGEPWAVREVRGRVRRIVAHRGYRFGAEDRQDIVQETMTQIWQAANRSGFEAGARFWGYVEVVTARRCIDRVRSGRRRARFEQPLETAGSAAVARTEPLREALRGERGRLASRALEQLGKPCRELIQLHAGMNRSYREISALLGRSEGALRVQMFRCVRKARRILAELEGSARGREGGTP